MEFVAFVMRLCILWLVYWIGSNFDDFSHISVVIRFENLATAQLLATKDAYEAGLSIERRRGWVNLSFSPWIYKMDVTLFTEWTLYFITIRCNVWGRKINPSTYRTDDTNWIVSHDLLKVFAFSMEMVDLCVQDKAVFWFRAIHQTETKNASQIRIKWLPMRVCVFFFATVWPVIYFGQLIGLRNLMPRK